MRTRRNPETFGRTSEKSSRPGEPIVLRGVHLFFLIPFEDAAARVPAKPFVMPYALIFLYAGLVEMMLAFP